MVCGLAAGCGHRARPDVSVSVRTVAELRSAPLHTFNERELDVYLAWLRAATPSVQDRVAVLARQAIGQPYRIFLLGEGPFELHDPDPLYCLSASDCVTFVEHVYAMALSDDWSSFFRTLQRIRYRDGRIGVLTRNHFTEADWNRNNAWLFEDVTGTVFADAAAPMRTVVDRAALFAKYGLTPDVPHEVVEGRYVPRERIASVADRLRDGDIVEVVRGDDALQYVSHMGLVLHDSAGRPTLAHSTKPAVREELLDEYLRRNREVLGCKFLRMRRNVASESAEQQTP